MQGKCKCVVCPRSIWMLLLFSTFTFTRLIKDINTVFVKRRRVGFGDDIITTSVVSPVTDRNRSSGGAMSAGGRYIINSDEEIKERSKEVVTDRQQKQQQQSKEEQRQQKQEKVERIMMKELNQKASEVKSMEDFIALCDELKSRAGPDEVSIGPLMIVVRDIGDGDGRSGFINFFVHIPSIL